MKPPPQLAVLLILLAGGANSNTPCDKFKKKISLGTGKSIGNYELIGSYINHVEDNRFVLNCYKDKIGLNTKKGRKNNYVAVITSLETNRIVTIKEMDCSSQGYLSRQHYMFSFSHERKNKNYLALGVLFRENNEETWCRYDICLDCTFSFPQIQANADHKPKVGFFRWSEKGIKISSKPNIDKGERSIGTVEYLSIGDPKFVLTCTSSGQGVVRSIEGQGLIDFNCSPWNPIQTFLIYTITTEEKTEYVKMYQLAQKEPLKDKAWYEGSGGKDSQTMMLYYFRGQSTSKNCYWKQIKSDQPNSCPSLPHDEMILTTSGHDTIRKGNKLTAVAQYKNGRNPRITLICFKTGEGERSKYFSFMNYSTGEHVVTTTSIDCSSKDNLDDKFDVRTRHGDEDMDFVVVGSRWSLEDDWCWYSIFKKGKGTIQENIRVLAYYDYKSTDVSHLWKEVNLGDCTGLDVKHKSLDDEGPARTLIASYLWVAPIKTDSLLLYCYESSTSGTQYFGVIKTLEDENIASIPGIDCSSKTALDKMYYMFVEKIENVRYLAFGTYSSAKQHWCRYDFCVDCVENEVKQNIDSNPWNRAIEWTEAGIEWKRGVQSPRRYARNIVKQYVSDGTTKFVLSCTKLKEGKEEKHEGDLRMTNGIHIADISFNSQCLSKITTLEFYFLKKSTDGKLDVIDKKDCADGCDVDPGNGNEKTWLYYTKRTSNKNRMFSFEVKDKTGPNSCKVIKRENILTKGENLNGELKISYWMGMNPMFKLSCYTMGSGTGVKYYAVITHNDDHILTLQNFYCLERHKIYQNLYIHTSSGNEDFASVVLGSRNTTIGEKEWCWYSILRTEDQDNVWVYYDYKPDEVAFQWYENDSENCPTLNKEDIAVHSKSTINDPEMGSLIQTRVGKYQSVYMLLYCYEKTGLNDKKLYTSVLKSPKGAEYAEVIMIKGLSCSDKRTEYPLIYEYVDMFYMQSNEKVYLSLVTKRSKGSTAKCRYDICLKCKTPEIRVNFDRSKPGSHVIRWSEPGIQIESRPSLNQVFYPTDEEGKQLQEEDLISVYYTYGSNIKFQLQCYNIRGKFVNVIMTPRGVHLGTFGKFKCTNELSEYNTFDNVYIHTTNGIETIHSGDIQFYEKPENKRWLCWYFGCDERDYSSHEDTWIFYFNNSPSDTKYFKWKAAIKRPYESFNSCPDLEKKYISTTKQLEKHWLLIAKYTLKGETKLQLLCYQMNKVKTFEYLFVFADTSGQPIATISNYDCSPRNKNPDQEIFFTIDRTESAEAKEFILLGSGSCGYRVCRFCDAPVIAIDYTFNLQLTWEQVPLYTCPWLKREDIHKDENQIKITEDKLIARYMNYDEDEKGKFVLSCYTNDIGEYVSVIRTLQGSHLVSFKGPDCSTRTNLNRVSYITIRRIEEKQMLFLGTRIDVQIEYGPWCQYDVCLDCETFEVSTNPIPSKDIFESYTNPILSEEDIFEWSEAGIQIEKCPSPNLSEFGHEYDQSEIVAEYLHKESQTLVLECVKQPNLTPAQYILQLRTSGRFYFLVIHDYEHCFQQINLMKQFYVHTKNTKNQIQLFKMDQPDVQNIIESCWNNGIKTDIWFYYFPSDMNINAWLIYWKELNKYDEDCSIVRKEEISNEKTFGTMEVKAEYWSGGDEMVKLTCYADPATTRTVATISNSLNEHLVSINNLNCLSQSFYQRFCVEIKDNKILVGSKELLAPDLCWFGIQQQDQVATNVWRYYGHKPKTTVCQWYKGEEESCPAVKRGDIFTDENQVGLKNKILDAVHVLEVFDNAENTFKQTKTEYILNYCYYSEDAEGQRLYVLVIVSQEGRHLASIKGFDCSSQTSLPLTGKTYMFTLEDYGSTNKYLAFVTRTSPKDEWCRYDICLNCDTKKVRLNVDNEYRTDVMILRWTKPGIKIYNSPSLKNQQPTFDKRNTEPYIVHLRQKEPYFVIECYLPNILSTKIYSVLRTTTGLHIATMMDLKCESEISSYDLGYVLIHIQDGTITLKELDLGKPLERGDESCWYYGCKTSTVKETWIFIKQFIPETFNELSAWHKVPLLPASCPRLLVKSNFAMDQADQDGKMKLISKYKNSREFELSCYRDSGDVKATSVISDFQGKHLATIQGLSCSATEELQDKIDVTTLEKFYNDNDDDLIIVGINSEDFCSYIICRNCEKENAWRYIKKETTLVSKWTKVATETCYTFDEKNIVTSEGEVDLSSYEVIATYMNDGEEEKNTFVLFCYSSKGVNEITQLKTLEGRLIVFLKNLDCSSYDKLTKLSYMSIEMTQEKRYLVLGTREKDSQGPWCRYDICISCKDNEIRVNAMDDPGSLKVFKWLKAGIKTTCPTETKCGDISHDNRISQRVHPLHPNFSIDCHDVGDSQDKKYCSVVKRGNIHLGSIAHSDCIADIISSRNIYLYTHFSDSTVSLFHLGQTQENPDKSTEDGRTVNENWFYYFVREDLQPEKWKLVTNPRMSMMESRDFMNEKGECLPQDIQPTDLFTFDADEGTKKESPKKGQGVKVDCFGLGGNK